MITYSAKAKNAHGKISYGMAGFVDERMDHGITWDRLVAICKPESERRGLKSYQTLSYLKGHARHRAKVNNWHVVEMDDERVRIVRPQ
jgi:hypothetical protein